jgi:hypothetical protein
MNDILQKDRAVLARALANFHYERMGDGRVLFPRQRTIVGGVFTMRVDGGLARMAPNRYVGEGLDDLLNVYFRQSTQRTAFYVALFTGDVTVADSLTAAAFAGTMTEFTGYSESTRVAWQRGTVAAHGLTNSATPARFTITDEATIHGAALLTAQAKSATTGVLCACGHFNDGDEDYSQDVRSGNKLDIEYELTASDAADVE